MALPGAATGSLPLSRPRPASRLRPLPPAARPAPPADALLNTALALEVSPGRRSARVLAAAGGTAPPPSRLAGTGAELVTLPRPEGGWIGILAAPPGAIRQLPRHVLDPWAQEAGIALGASSPVEDPRYLSAALEEAESAVRLVERALGTGCRGVEDLGPYRWILTLSLSQLWQVLLGPELGPVLRLEAGETARLLPVLDALLRTGGDRLQAAALLELSLPELETRLARLAQQLGSDFLSPARRAILQAAWIAYRLRAEPENLLPAGQEAAGAGA
ncbi:protein of unknown function [Candidatus Hydrogenisulfobacillus filiaventi]|uniref:PucR C-terminal helix-turn-helix domain-containing protein n=1 Tax=Candidatus Hydrogenisulfobacillus filiaventi TaxID=2707344 RepID=A0A6F8ZK92_9FIRM|nr:hypothetical protein [Bacillota bacterium]CAB1130022.1 protein of unknown function [Candidatus Hydrogenisulfobacillus filiaventi]